MLNKIKLLNIIIILSIQSPISLAFDATKNFEEAFATAVVLTDNDTISLGFGNFNPEVLLKPSQPHLVDHLTTGDSLELRNQLSVFSVPYTYILNEKNKEWSDKITFHLAYIKQDTTHNLFDDTQLQPDDNIDKIYSSYLAYSRYIPLSKRWKLRMRLGGYLMHYDNSHNYNSSLSKSFEPRLDGVYFNTQANAAIIEPNAKLTYTKDKSWGKWELSSDFNYFTGKVYSGSASSKNAKPSGWRVNNTVKFHYDLNLSKLDAESLYVKFQRSDIGGDMNSALDTAHFYEFGVGILLDTRKLTDWVENVGVGININHGSSLNGGSIVFYFNEF